MNLLDLPTETLSNIFSNFYYTLIVQNHIVCKKFQTILTSDKFFHIYFQKRGVFYPNETNSAQFCIELFKGLVLLRKGLLNGTEYGTLIHYCFPCFEVRNHPFLRFQHTFTKQKIKLVSDLASRIYQILEKIGFFQYLEITNIYQIKNKIVSFKGEEFSKDYKGQKRLCYKTVSRYGLDDLELEKSFQLEILYFVLFKYKINLGIDSIIAKIIINDSLKKIKYEIKI